MLRKSLQTATPAQPLSQSGQSISPPLSPKPSPRGGEHDSLESPSSEGWTNDELKKLIETGTKEAKLELAVVLMKEYFSQVTSKEEAKIALVAVKSITVSLGKMQSRMKREKRKKSSKSLKSSSSSNAAAKEKQTGATVTVPPLGSPGSSPTSSSNAIGVEASSPPLSASTSPVPESVLSEHSLKKPSLMDLLEFLRATSTTEETSSPTASEPTDATSKEASQPGLGQNSLAAVGGKHSSLIDLFEFREPTNKSSPTHSPSTTLSLDAVNSLTEAKLTSEEVKPTLASTGIIRLSALKTTNLKTRDSAMDLFDFLSGGDDEEEDEDEDEVEIRKILNIHRAKMGTLLLDVIILEVADLKIKESSEVYVTLQQNNEMFETATVEGSSLTFDEDATFTVSDPSSPLIARVYNDKDMCLGEVAIEISSLEDGSVHDEWFTLQNKKEKSGRIHMRLNYKLENGLLAGIGMSSATIPIRVKTGDILLFDKRTNLLSYGTKLITRSRWDHVAMVIVLCNTTMMLEATSTDGVQLYPLDEKLEAYRQISNIGVRRLHGAPTKEMLRLLLDFIYEVKGRPYEKNLIQLLKAVYGEREALLNQHGKSTSSSENDLSALFCSELVAAAYQRMGLLSSTIQTNSFSPKDFSSDKFVFSTNEAYLGRVIVFKRRKPNRP